MREVVLQRDNGCAVSDWCSLQGVHRLGIERVRLEPVSLKRRFHADQQIERRLLVAKAELAAVDEFPHVVRNDDLSRATYDLAEIVRSATA